MISYDSYQNRIKRVAAIKNFIVRFRLLFIAIAVLIVAVTFTLLGITGIVTKDIVLPENPVYGEAFTFEEPEALLSGAEYQFRYLGKPRQSETAQKTSVRASFASDTSEKSGEWTYETPFLAGRYEVRVVTKSGFGGKKYGTPKQFEIESKPLEFLITADALTYGTAIGKGSYSFPLVNGDTLAVEGVTFLYDDPSLDITGVCANSESFLILNKNGEDVTFCYDVSTPKKEVVLEQKPITLSLENGSFEYDGKQINYVPELSPSTQSALRGDKIEFETVITDANGTVVQTLIDAGTYTVSIKPEVSFFNGDKDVSKHYLIENSPAATFTVRPRKINVTTNSDSKEYDGAPLSNSGFSHEGLVSGHTVSAVTETSVVEAGEYVNRFDFAVYDENGTAVTENYDFVYNFGTLSVLKREITVNTPDRVKVYDAKPLTESDFNGYSIIGNTLADGHTQSLVFASSLINADSVPNAVKIAVYDENGVAVTQNYNVTYVYGTLTVGQREITVTTPTRSWQYDSYAHSDSAIQIVSPYGGTPLADGEEYVITGASSVTFVTEGGVENSVSCTIVRSDGVSDVTSNYKITLNCGTLSITRRPVTITTPSVSKVYDGLTLSGNEGEIIADNLADNDRIISNYAYDVISVKSVVVKENTTKFKISDLSAQLGDVLTSADERTQNYEITYIFGILEITKRDITIHTPTVEKTYDGTPLKGDSRGAVADNLAEYEYLKAYEVAERTPAGTVLNKTKYKVFRPVEDEFSIPDNSLWDMGENGEVFGYETSQNYNIIAYEYGNITVLKRYVGIATPSGSKEYDGTAFTLAEGYEYPIPPSADSESASASGTGLLEGHSLVLDESIDPNDVTNVSEDKVINAVYFRIFSGEEDVTENYVILYNFGKIFITKRNVRLVTASDEFFYAETAFSNPSATSAHIALVDGEWIEDGEIDFVLDHTFKADHIFETGLDINLDGYENKCAYKVYAENGNGEDVSLNYELELHIIYGRLIVKRRPIYITVEGGSKVYDDTPYQNINSTAEPFDTENPSGIVDGQWLVLDTDRKIASVTYVTEGKILNEQYYFINTVRVGEDGESVTVDVSDNYDIAYHLGYIFVTERPITIKTLSGAKEFDGQPYSLASVNAEEVISAGSLAQDHSLSVLSSTSVTYVTEGEVDNKVTYAVLRGEDNLSENYAITYDTNYGKLSITKRSVYVLTASREWTYDGDEHFDYSYIDSHIRDGVPVGEDGLVSEHRLKVTRYAAVINCADTSENNNICLYTVVTSDSERDMSGNYDLTVEYGTLTILQRNIIITTATETHWYNGDPFSCTDGWSDVGGLDLNGVQLDKGLVKNHTLKVRLDENGNEIKTTVTEVKRDADGKIERVPNVVEYEVFDGVDFVTGNYSIEYIYGTLAVAPRPIIIRTGSYKKIYDGTPLYCEEFSLPEFNKDNYGLLTDKNHSVVSGDEPLNNLRYLYVNEDGTLRYEINVELAESVSYASITYITKIDGKLINSVRNMRSYKITDANGKDISYNYHISINAGILTILERPLTVTTPTLCWDYDGKFHSGLEEQDTETGKPVFDNLVDSEIHLGAAEAVIIDFVEGGIENTIAYSFYTIKNIITNYCYDIEYIYGRLYINKINLAITNSSPMKIYDGSPLLGDTIADGLPSFDGKLNSETVKPYDVSSLTDYGVLPNTTRYTVWAVREGNEVETTGNYVISYTDGTLTVNQREITIETLSASHEYDGEKFTSTAWKDVGDLKLVAGHTLAVVDVIGEITDVGSEVVNEVIYKVVDINGNEVVNGGNLPNYIIKYVYGTLTVTPRIIRITTATDSWVYDAEEHFNDYADCVHIRGGAEDDTAKGLVLDHKLETLTYETVLDVDSKPNVCTYKIVDGSGSDVTKNYLFDDNTYEYGTLTVTKRPLTIKTATDYHEYDGTAFSKADGYIVESFDKDGNRGLIPTHTASLDTNCKIPSVTYVHDGEVENRLIFILKDGVGVPVTENYKIEYVYGKISVTPHTIAITNPSLSKVYDGTPLYGYGDGHKPEVIGLVAGDSLTADIISRLTDVGEIINATTYRITSADGTLIYDGDGEVADSYIISYTDGATLTVTSASLRITTASLEKIYDGQPLFGENALNGDEAKQLSPFKIEYYDIGSGSWIEGLIEGEYEADKNTVKTLTDVSKDTVYNTTKYLVFADRDGVLTDITANYGEIEYVHGTLNVTARKIIITTADENKEFDGTPLVNTTAEVTAGDPLLNYTLAEGHSLSVKDGIEIPSVTYVTDGEVENILEYDVVDENGVKVSGDNYLIVRYIYGKLFVTERNISITTVTKEFEYNGKAQGDDRYTALYLNGSGNAFADGHTLEVITPFRISCVYENSAENNVMEYRIVDAEKIDRTENYLIVDYFGTITIKARPVIIVLNEIGDITYGETLGGYPLTADGKMFTYEAGSAKTVENEELEIEIAYYQNGSLINNPVNAGVYNVDAVSKKIVGGYADISNYDVSVKLSSFTINQKEITINLLAPENGGKQYDGKQYVFPQSLGSGYEFDGDSAMAYGEELTVSVRYIQNGEFVDNVFVPLTEKELSDYPIDAGSYLIVFDAENCTLNNGGLISNYKINCATDRIGYVITQIGVAFKINTVTLTYTSEAGYQIENDGIIDYENSRLPLAEGEVLIDVNSTVRNTDGSYPSSLCVGVYETIVQGFDIHVGDKDGKAVSQNYYLDETDASLNRAKFEIVKRQVNLSVWFVDVNGASASSSNEYSGEVIDLNALYPDGAYKSNVLNDNYNDFGVSDRDRAYLRPVFSVSQNGAQAELKDRGIYEITIEDLVDKDGSDVRKNYEIIGCDSGTFELTRRQIIVTPKTVQTDIAYNGKAIDQSCLDYDTLHKFEPNDKGFIKDSDKQDYKAVYKLYEKGTTTDVINAVLQAGTYLISVELEYIGAEGEEKYEIVGYNYSAEFTVLPRTVYVATYDDEGDYVYNKTVHGDKSAYQFTAYVYENGEWSKDAAFCNDDLNYADPEFAYEHENGEIYSDAQNAGSYTIKVLSFGGANGDIDILRNYDIKDFPVQDGERSYGKLTVRPANVLIVPLPYSKPYNGVNVLEMPEDNFSIEYVEGSEDKTLFGGDRLSVKFSGKATVSTGMSVVRITEVNVVYPDSVADGIENYNVICSYSKLKEYLPSLSDEYSVASFIATLEFIQRTLKISQFAPPDEFKQVEYGTIVKIKIADQSGLNDCVLSGCDGLVEGHNISLGTVIVPASETGLIKNWLGSGSIKITDSANANVTNGYKIEVVYEGADYEDTYIQVVPRTVTVRVNFAPSEVEEGVAIDPSAYRIEQGSFVYGDKLTVSVVGNKFAAVVRDFSGENDRSSYYNVIFNYIQTENQVKEESI